MTGGVFISALYFGLLGLVGGAIGGKVRTRKEVKKTENMVGFLTRFDTCVIILKILVKSKAWEK